MNDDISKHEETLPTEIVNSILDVYNECIHIPTTNMKNNVTIIGQIDEIK
jgi:hypothetical protein